MENPNKDSEVVGGENRRLFEDLRAQILHNSALDQSANIFGDSPAATGLSNISGSCPACQKLQEMLSFHRKEHNSAKDRISNLESQVDEAHKRDLEAFQKVQEAVDVAEKTSAALAEAEMSFKNLKEALEEKEKELRECKDEQRKAIDSCRETVGMEYRTELDIAQKQVIRLEAELRTMQDRVTLAESRNKELEAGREEAKIEARSIDAENKQKLEELGEQLNAQQSEKHSLDSDLRSTKQQLELVQRLHEQKVVNLEEKCEHLSWSLSEAKAEASESRERWLLANEEKAKLEKQLILCNQELKRLKGNLEEAKLEAEREIQVARMEALDIQNKKRFDVEDLVSKQNTLVTKLKEECASLTQELARKTKEQRKNVKVLSREKRQLANKLVEIADKRNESDESD